MVTTEVGWAVGAQHILRTTNGGRSWTNVTPSGAGFADLARGDIHLQAMGVHHAWVVAMFPQSSGPVVGRVYRTNDGGGRWQSTTVPGDFRAQLDFLSDSSGYLMLMGQSSMMSEAFTLLRTQNGGATWTQVSVQAMSSHCAACLGGKTGVAFANASDGYITGDTAASKLLLYSSGDGGATWASAHLSVPSTDPNAAVDGNATTLPPIFFGTQDGVLPVSIFSPTKPFLDFYDTTNGGRTWTPTVVVPGTLWSFSDALHGVVLDGTDLERTVDGGKAWSSVSPNVNLRNASDMDFLTPELGWIVDGGQILATTDGGHTWSDLTTVDGPEG